MVLASDAGKSPLFCLAWQFAGSESRESDPRRDKANARLVYPKPRQRKVQIQGFFASLRMTKFDGGYSNLEFALAVAAFLRPRAPMKDPQSIRRLLSSNTATFIDG